MSKKEYSKNRAKVKINNAMLEINGYNLNMLKFID